MKVDRKTVLHIEDDPCLANLVKLTFENFGFTGEFLQATGVEEAFNLLAERKQKKRSVDLILSDMHLPDGRGLDLLRNIKACPSWSKIPVIILSSDSSPNIVSEAYALGANCYLSKLPRRGRGFEHFRSLYQFWIENALVPESSFVNGIQEVLSKAISLRARTAQFYLALSGLPAPHAGQDASIFTPHSVQKRESARFSVPHFWHSIAILTHESSSSSALASFRSWVSKPSVNQP